MNSSSMCEQTTIATPQMPNFMRDKQAWENAISHYQGVDPLDHWYNYVCWYENYGHGDPENKFRETLERCLGIFEHNECYKQDIRMLRLWFKYIDMQANPLTYYQELYHRNIGRKLAAFYLKWGAYYESFNAWKEAEAVYNLGFQEEAQQITDLQRALTKVVYSRAALQEQLLQQQQPQHQSKLAQDQQASYEQMKLQRQQLHAMQHTTHALQQQQEQQHHHQDQLEAGSSTNYHKTQQQMAFDQQQQNHHHVQHHQQQQQQQQLGALDSKYEQYNQPQHEQFQQQQQHQHSSQTTTSTNAYHTVYTQQQQNHHYHTPHINQIQQQHNHEEQLTIHNHPQQHHHLHHHQQQQQHQSQQQQHSPYTHTHLQEHFLTNQLHQSDVEATATSTTQEEVEVVTSTIIQQHSNLNSNESQVQAQQYYDEITEREQEQHLYYQEEKETECANETTGVVQFANTEIPSFKYPENFVNYSSVPQVAKPLRCLAEPWSSNRKIYYAKENVYPEHEDCEYSPEELVVMKKYANLSTNHVDDNDDAVLQYVEIPTASIDKPLHNGQSIAEETLAVISENSCSSSTSSNKEDNYGFSEREDGDAAAESAEDDNDDSDADYETANDLDTQNYVRLNYIKQDIIPPNNNNLPIKIKLKKERTSNDANGSYKITNIYQHEISSPKSSTSGRNGHNFHPYLDNASTPKASSVSRRHAKSRLKNTNNDDEFPQSYCINSNSSTNEPAKSGNHHHNHNHNNNQIAAVSSANDNAVQNANFNDNANYSFSSAVNFENSNCSITSAVDRLNFRDNSALGVSFNNSASAALKNTTTTNVDVSTYQENSYFATQYDTEAKEKRLSRALETIEHHLSKDIIDPFNSELCRAFLTKIDFPGNNFETHDNYKITQTPFPKIANTKVLNLGVGVVFNIDKEVGRGAYGSVYKATSASTGSVVALKCTKPANTWEIYICDQVLKRIKQPDVLPGFMDISTAIISPNASLIATEFSPFGSLLDINNKLRQATTKVMHESLVMHFSAQICSIVHHLHKQKIIHADIKPDNFLLMRVPSTELPYPSVRLIDFGCAIDMTMFPNENTKFRKVIQTDGFTCIEMQEGRPWSYETDLFCVAGTIHVMLFGDYMHAQKRAGTWDIKQKLPRYFKKHVWTQFFSELLNINAAKMPNLDEMRKIFREEAALMDSELQKQIRTLSNILYKR